MHHFILILLIPHVRSMTFTDSWRKRSTGKWNWNKLKLGNILVFVVGHIKIIITKKPHRNRREVFKEICHQYRKYPSDWQGERVKECEWGGLGLSSFPAFPKKRGGKMQGNRGLSGCLAAFRSDRSSLGTQPCPSSSSLTDTHRQKQSRQILPGTRVSCFLTRMTHNLPLTPITALSASISALFFCSG